MKKIATILSCTIALFAMTSCDWFKLDNLDAWDASVEGKIIDQGTNEPVQMEQGNALSVYEKYGEQYDHTNQLGEKGWDGNSPVNWYVKNNGTYVNKLTFAGKYEMESRNLNFYAERVAFELKKGSNTVDFKVTPYLRVKNVQLSATSANVITAKCDIEVAVPGTTVSVVELCIYPDRWVRHGNGNNALNDPMAKVTNPSSLTGITLEIDPKRKVKDVEVNRSEFQYDRPHYVRIAALGLNSKKSGEAYNYSAVYKLENGTFTEVTDW